MIVENKPGGTGLIGAREVVKADPDGYTLLLANAGATVIPAAMSNNYPIDLNKDLLPIGLTAEFVGVVMAKKDLPVNSMQEFIAYAKTNPGKLNFGTSGVGSMVHLSAELLMKETGIKMQHLPYKGGSNSMADLLSGTIDLLFVSSPVAVGQAENKNLKMLAVTSRYRLQALPNVPTVEESGVPGFDTSAWLGVMGPAGLAPTIRQKLSTALVEIARDPDTQAKLRKIGFEPIGKDAAAFEYGVLSDLPQCPVAKVCQARHSVGSRRRSQPSLRKPRGSRQHLAALPATLLARAQSKGKSLG